MKYRYHLLKYAGRSTRFTCPSCGRRHCFATYVDEDNRTADIERYGRCDHESSCGYCLYPPGGKDWRESWNEYAARQSFRSKSVAAVPAPAQSAPDVCTIPADMVSRTVRLQPRSDFLRFLGTIASEEEITRAVNEYRIGLARGGAVVFYQIDTQGRCRTGKVMKYDPLTGHRIKDPSATTPITWVHSLLKQRGMLPDGWTLTQCLFGEHLLPQYPDKPVALVESEKTAVIASIFCPDFIWLATGGKAQMNDRVEVLRGRNIVAFPDIDGIEAWRRKAAERPTSPSPSPTSSSRTRPPKTTPPTSTSLICSSDGNRTAIPQETPQTRHQSMSETPQAICPATPRYSTRYSSRFRSTFPRNTTAMSSH